MGGWMLGNGGIGMQEVARSGCLENFKESFAVSKYLRVLPCDVVKL